MKLRLSILLLAAAVAAPAAGQTIKSLGYNTTNGQVVYSGSNSLTFTNALQFSTNARAATRTNLGGTTVGNALFTAATTNAARTALGASIVGGNIFTVPEQYQELYLRINADNTVSSLTPAATRTNLGLGGSDSVTFSNLSLSSNGSLAIGGMNVTAITSGIDLAFKRAGSTELELKTNGLILHVGSYSFSGGNTNGVSITRNNLGLGTTNAPTFSNINISIFGSGSSSGFAGRNSGGLFEIYGTNVSTSVPAFYGWSGSVNTAFSAGTARTNLELGATNAVTFSNVTASGTLTATGNATLNGSDNLMPNATNAASASSLMTRGLSDARYLPSFGEYMDGTFYRQTMADWMPTRVTNGGTATFDPTGSRWVLSSATNVGNLVALRIGRMEGNNNNGSSGANVMFGSGFSAFVFLSTWSRSNQVLRFVVGHSTGDPIGQYPTNRAVGVEFSGDTELSVRLIAHNGTTATNGPLVTGLQANPFAAYGLYAVRYYTNGMVELYRSVARGAFTNIASATISGGPTNNASISTAGAVDLAYDSGTNATTSTAGTRVHWWGYQYHD